MLQTLAGRELTHILAGATAMVGKALQRLKSRGTDVAAASQSQQGADRRETLVLAAE